MAQSYFYLSNLSNWHFSCVPQYSDAWLSQLDDLSIEEKKLLNKFKKIHKKYGFDDIFTNNYLGRPFVEFLKEANVWEEVKNIVNRDEYLILKKVFTVFKLKLDILWGRDKVRLEEVQGALEQEFKNPKAGEALDILEKLFGQAVGEIVVHVFAIPITAASPAGGANTKEGVVTLELRSAQDVREGFFIVLHEIAHYLIRKSKIQFDESFIENSQTLKQLPLFKEQGNSSGWEEAVLICFLPDGFIRNWLAGSNPKKKNRLNITRREDFENYLICRSQPKIKEYFSQNKIIDQKFANFVLEQSMEFITQSSNKFS